MLGNLAVWPPLRDRSAAHQIDAIDDRLGELLCEMATSPPAIDDWLERADDLDEGLDVVATAQPVRVASRR